MFCKSLYSLYYMKITVTGQFNEGEVLFIWEFYFPKLVHSLIEFILFFFWTKLFPKYRNLSVLPYSPSVPVPHVL